MRRLVIGLMLVTVLVVVPADARAAGKTTAGAILTLSGSVLCSQHLITRVINVQMDIRRIRFKIFQHSASYLLVLGLTCGRRQQASRTSGQG